MLTRQYLFAALVLLSIAYPASAVNNELGWTLEGTLKQLDRQTKDFDTALSDFTITRKTDEVEEVMTGRIYVNDDGDLRLRVTTPDEQTILVEKKEVQIYNPLTAVVEKYSLRKHRDRWEPFLRTGFIESGDLEDDYIVTLIGEDQLGDRRVLGLELTPKKSAVREVFSSLQLWIDQASWMPAQLVIEQVSTGTTISVDYKGTARNLKLNPDLFKDKWPRGTDKVWR